MTGVSFDTTGPLGGGGGSNHSPPTPPPPTPPPAAGGDNVLRQRRPQGMSKTQQSVRHVVSFSERKFDVKTLPIDMQRVYKQLELKNGEEQALLVIFVMRTAIELHRAWHMTLLTAKILQQVKDKFGLRMTWNLGVIRLIFRVDDGSFELHRKVPYDYDSEFQDLYMKIAEALVEGHITVHEALLFQSETVQGMHTAKSGLFLRDFPGRLVLYPFEAATCAVIFFGGDGVDAGIAALTGIVSGLIEYALCTIGGEAKILIDTIVGIATGVIGSLFYRYGTGDHCLSAIFLGTLYWFFYGTAFVIGLLEIIAGELETGVTRFIAVSVKTFVLCLGASFGMLITLPNPQEVWLEQAENCNTIDLDAQWWRIPLYLASSASALGQYRFPIVKYWRGLVVQLVGYEVQYQCFKYYAANHTRDNLDTASSNVVGAAMAVVAAVALGYCVDQMQYYYNIRLLQRDRGENIGKCGECMYALGQCSVRFLSQYIGRASDFKKLEMEKKLRQQREELNDPNHPRGEIRLLPEEESMLREAIVDAQNLNIWAVLMPALYQLVPGSMIAKMWFNNIFPPPLQEREEQVEGTDFTYKVYAVDTEQENIFSNLMVISTSLAVGLIVGFGLVQLLERAFCCWSCCHSGGDDEQRLQNGRDRLAGMYTVPEEAEDDPERAEANKDTLPILEEEEEVDVMPVITEGEQLDVAEVQAEEDAEHIAEAAAAAKAATGGEETTGTPAATAMAGGEETTGTPAPDAAAAPAPMPTDKISEVEHA